MNNNKMTQNRYKHFSEWIFWLAAIYNIVFTLLLVVGVLLYEIDTFLLVWFGVMPLFVTLPIGLIGVGYAFGYLKSIRGRFLQVSLLLPIAIYHVIYVFPSAAERVPTAMVQHYETEGDKMRKIAEYVNALLPDNTYIHCTNKDEVRTLATLGERQFWNPYVCVFSHFYSQEEKDSVLASAHITKQHLDTIKHMLCDANLDAIEVYKDEFVRIPFVSHGFSTWYFEIPFEPYSGEQMLQQEKDFECLPISAELSLHFHSGGPSQGDPFPCKEKLMKKKDLLTFAIDSCLLYWRQEDSVVTVLSFVSISDTDINLVVSYSYPNRLPYYSREFKECAIRNKFQDAEKFLTEDDYWGYWVTGDGKRSNFVFVCGDGKDRVPRSLLDVNQLQDVRTVHFNEKPINVDGGGHAKRFRIIHKSADSIISKDTPADQLIFQRIFPDYIAD